MVHYKLIKGPRVLRKGKEGSILALQGPGQGQILKMLPLTGVSETLAKTQGFRVKGQGLSLGNRHPGLGLASGKYHFLHDGDSLEVAWGVHIHKCKRKQSPSLIFAKCQSPLTNTHILGGCRFTAKLRIKRHNSTFRLLTQHLQKSSGGRWPILCADLGHKLVTNFSNVTPDIDTPHTLTTKTSNTQHKKAYRMTNQKTRTTHKPYPTTSYTRNIDQSTTNQISSGRWDLPSTSNASQSKTPHTAAEDKSKSQNANTPQMATYKQSLNTST